MKNQIEIMATLHTITDITHSNKSPEVDIYHR